MIKIGFRIGRRLLWLGFFMYRVVMDLERKLWNKLYIIKYNYKKFKYMLRNTQLYKSVYFYNYNFRYFRMVIVYFFCRGFLSFKEGYRKFFINRKNLVK